MNKFNIQKLGILAVLASSAGFGVWIMLPKTEKSIRLQIQMTPAAEASLVPVATPEKSEAAIASGSTEAAMLAPTVIEPTSSLSESDMIESKNRDLSVFAESSLERLLELANSDMDPSLIESAMILGEIESKYESDIQLSEHVISFYQDCAKLHDLAPALRAVCFNKAVKLSLISNGEIWDPKEIPQRIKELATQL